MGDARKDAQTIYEHICAASADRPFSFRSVEQMHREIAAWQANNPALANLRQAPLEVQTAFLSQSMEWLKAESRDHSNFRVTSTLVDAILHTLNAAPKPLPSDVVLKLLTELRESTVTRFYFPFDQFLSILTRDQVTEEIRAELRRLHLQCAPRPTGKIDERALQTSNLLAELMHVEGDKQLDAGRGPWSQIVFDEIAAKDNITASAWQGLLEHWSHIGADGSWNEVEEALARPYHCSGRIRGLGDTSTMAGPRPHPWTARRSPLSCGGFRISERRSLVSCAESPSGNGLRCW
jgi:hypothetical protein